jgi:hypothetical protein
VGEAQFSDQGKKAIRASDAKEEGVGNPLKKRADTRIKSELN